MRMVGRSWRDCSAPATQSNTRISSAVSSTSGQAQGKSLVGDQTPAYVDRSNAARPLAERQVRPPRPRRPQRVPVHHQLGTSLQNRPPLYSLGRACRDDDGPLVGTSGALGHEDGTPLGPELYHEVRYEELVAEPAKTCACLFGFLDIPYDEAMLKFHEGRTKTKPGLDAKGHGCPSLPDSGTGARRCPRRTSSASRRQSATC